MVNHLGRIVGWCCVAGLLGCSGFSPGPRDGSASEEIPVSPSSSPVALHPSPGFSLIFDGISLADWAVANFGGEGPVEVRHGAIRLGRGEMLTGVTYKGEFPIDSYELAFEARRVSGRDFFCGVTFPVGKDYCSFIAGGWGGGIMGVSSVDGRDASENETSQVRSFENGRWYPVRVRVSPGTLTVDFDNLQVVRLPREGKRFSVRPEVRLSIPLGFAAYQTTAEVRRIEVRRIPQNP